MKLQDFLIGIGLFSLFTVIIFGAIDNQGGDCEGIYCKNYLNITHDSNTSKLISNVSSMGKATEQDFQGTRDDMKKFATNRSIDGNIITEGQLLGEAVKTIISLPNSWKPISRVLQTMETLFNIPQEFTQWMIGSIVIIIILILLASFLKNKLQS